MFKWFSEDIEINGWKVQNVEIENWKEYPYMVARNCNDELWFYGCYKTKENADAAMKEIRNGKLIEL